MKNKFFFLPFLAATFMTAQIFSEPTLQKVSEALSKNKITRGEFSLEKFSAKTSRSLKSSGRFTIAAEHGIIWFTESPVKITEVLTKNFLVKENAHKNRTKTFSAENKIFLQMAALTSSLFTNDLQQAQKVATIDFLCQNQNWEITLFPKDASVKTMLEKIVVAGEFKNQVCVAKKMQMVFSDKSVFAYALSGHEFFETLTEKEKSLFEE